MKFKIGDIVENKDYDGVYCVTSKENEFKGIVINIDGYFIRVRVMENKDKNEIGREYNVDSSYFKLVDSQENIESNLKIKKYIINKDACIIFWEDDTKTVVKKMKDAKFNKELGFLTAYFQKQSGLTKSKANKFLENLKVVE